MTISEASRSDLHFQRFGDGRGLALLERPSCAPEAKSKERLQLVSIADDWKDNKNAIHKKSK